MDEGTWSGWAKSTVDGRAMCGLCVNLAADGSVEAGMECDGEHRSRAVSPSASPPALVDPSWPCAGEIEGDPRIDRKALGCEEWRERTAERVQRPGVVHQPWGRWQVV